MQPPNETGIRVAGLDDLATVPHQKGDVRMITLTTDKIDMLLSASSSLSSNFLTLMIGITVAIFMALKSGGVTGMVAGNVLDCVLVFTNNSSCLLCDYDNYPRNKKIQTEK